MVKIETPNDELIGKMMRAGATIYRKSGSNVLYIVPAGETHSDAWKAVNV